jgi:sortase A
VTPILPSLSFWLKNKLDNNQGYKYRSNLTKNDAPDNVKRDLANLPDPPNKRLLIPSMQLDAEVFEGASANTLTKGVWRRPRTSTPDKGGNTVLIAHRFDYNGPAVFYHLDVLKNGDKFAVFWNGSEYDYQVSQVKIVEPTAIEIEDATAEPTLTLYTCTPMWTAKQRLVVVAKLISETKL